MGLVDNSSENSIKMSVDTGLNMVGCFNIVEMGEILIFLLVVVSLGAGILIV